MNQDRFQNGFHVYKQCIDNIRHFKTYSHHSLDDYADVEELLE